MSENIHETIKMLQDIADVSEEFDAAQLVRKEDPARWEAAKNAYQEKRTFWRTVKEAFVNGTEDDGTVVAGAISAKTTIKNEEVS